MLTITIDNTERHIKAQLEEISIADFERLYTVLAEEREDILDKYIEIFSILGLPDEALDVMTPKEFLDLAKQFTEVEWNSSEFKKDITVDNKLYVGYTGDKFKLSVRDLAKIEKYLKAGDGRCMGEILAVIYKDTSIPKEQQYSEEHIKEKAELFRKHLTADVVLPYINLISKDVVETLQNGFSK